MSTPKEEKTKLIEQRWANILAHMRAGLSAADIAAREGHDFAQTGKDMKALRNKHPDLPAAGTSETVPYGLGDGTHTFRSRVADHLHRLHRKHDPIEVARMIGVTQKAQGRAVTRPFNYDWTLSQLERLAAARGITFEELKNAPID